MISYKIMSALSTWLLLFTLECVYHYMQGSLCLQLFCCMSANLFPPDVVWTLPVKQLKKTSGS